jgi:hypothetical protein
MSSSGTYITLGSLNYLYTLNLAEITDDNTAVSMSSSSNIFFSNVFSRPFTNLGTYGWLVSIAISSSGQYQSFISNNAKIVLSSDYGKTWASSPDTSNNTNKGWSFIAMSQTGQYQIAGVIREYIYVSSNFGVSWTQIVSTGLRWWTAGAISSTGQYQIAGGWNGGPYGGAAYYSNNYGSTWTMIPYATVADGVSMTCSSSGKYMSILSSGGNLYTSNNYGVSWRTNATTFTGIKPF